MRTVVFALSLLAASGCKKAATAATSDAGSPSGPASPAADEEACKQVAERYFKALSASDVEGLEPVLGGNLLLRFQQTINSKGPAALAAEMQEQAVSAGIKGLKVGEATRVDADKYKVHVVLQKEKDGLPSVSDQSMVMERIDGKWKVTSFGN